MTQPAGGESAQSGVRAAVVPDPALGLLETMLVRAGRVVRLDGHLARLTASLATLYGLAAPDDLRVRVERRAREVRGEGVLRLSAWPEGARIAIELELMPPRQRSLPVALAPVQCPGGLGPHKWRDREWLDGVAPNGRPPLLIDGDGMLLEAAFGNLFVERDGLLLTPPASGTLLPGVTRAALIEAARSAGVCVLEQPLTLDDALDAERLFVTSALAGVAPAVLDGARCTGDPLRARELAQLLERAVHR